VIYRRGPYSALKSWYGWYAELRALPPAHAKLMPVDVVVLMAGSAAVSGARRRPSVPKIGLMSLRVQVSNHVLCCV
jgi:hypothetical protein